MVQTEAGAKLDVQMEMLADVAPELVAEVRRLSAIVVGVTEAVLKISEDTTITKQYNVSKYTQGRIDVGDYVVDAISEALAGRGKHGTE